MKGKEFSKRISIIISFAAFFIALAVLLFAAYPIQYKLGNIGLVITELLVLGIAIVGCLVTRQKFSEMFPIKLPKLRHVFGALIVWLAMYIMSMASAAVSGMFMPERFFAVGTAFDGMSLPFKLFALAILPPICEEALHRGLVMHFLKPIERRWIIILIIGVQFGVLHWEPMKFLSTGIAGACLAYVLIKTGNMILCALMHFLTNLPAALATASGATATDFNEVIAVPDDTGAITEIVLDGSMMTVCLGIAAGVFLIICAAAPWLFYAGSVLLGNKGEISPYRKKKLVACTVLSVAAAIMGFVMLVVSFVMLTASIM